MRGPFLSCAALILLTSWTQSTDADVVSDIEFDDINIGPITGPPYPSNPLIASLKSPPPADPGGLAVARSHLHSRYNSESIGAGASALYGNGGSTVYELQMHNFAWNVVAQDLFVELRFDAVDPFSNPLEISDVAGNFLANGSFDFDFTINLNDGSSQEMQVAGFLTQSNLEFGAFFGGSNLSHSPGDSFFNVLFDIHATNLAQINSLSPGEQMLYAYTTGQHFSPIPEPSALGIGLLTVLCLFGVRCKTPTEVKHRRVA